MVILTSKTNTYPSSSQIVPSSAPAAAADLLAARAGRRGEVIARKGKRDLRGGIGQGSPASTGLAVGECCWRKWDTASKQATEFEAAQEVSRWRDGLVASWPCRQ